MLDLLIIFAVSRFYSRLGDSPQDPAETAPAEPQPVKVWELTPEAQAEWKRDEKKALKAQSWAIILFTPFFMGVVVTFGGFADTLALCALDNSRECVSENLSANISATTIGYGHAILDPVGTAADVAIYYWPFYWPVMVVTYVYLVAVALNALLLIWVAVATRVGWVEAD